MVGIHVEAVGSRGLCMDKNGASNEKHTPNLSLGQDLEHLS
jgi:hypothetical protein